METHGVLKELAKQINLNARQKGFWDDHKKFIDPNHKNDYLNTKLLLIASEVIEAMDELRTGYDCGVVRYIDKKPEGFKIELIDVIIRCLDLLGFLYTDVDELMKEKMEYNTTRASMHNKQF